MIENIKSHINQSVLDELKDKHQTSTPSLCSFGVQSVPRNALEMSMAESSRPEAMVAQQQEQEIEYEDGSKFIGQIIKQGYGVLESPDGSIFSGSFVNDLREGPGRLVTSLGDVFEGTWSNDQLNGHGTHKYSNGDFFQGNFVNGIKSGQGHI